MIEASWFALLDAMCLELMRFNEEDPHIQKAVEDYWLGSANKCPEHSIPVMGIS